MSAIGRGAGSCVIIVRMRKQPAAGVPEQDGHASLGADVAICMRVQRLAAPVRGGQAGAHKHEGRLPVHGEVHAHREPPRAAAVAEAAAHDVRGDQRGGAGCVDADAGSLQHTPAA